MRTRSWLFDVAGTALVASAFTGCTDPAAPPVPTGITAAAADTQTGVVGTAVTSPPSVQVTTTGGAPLGGVSVTFSVVSGEGSLEGAQQTTDANGVATLTRWTLGTQAGDNAVAARVASLQPVLFAATATPDRAATVELSRDSVHFDAIGDTVRLTAAVTDRHTNALSEPQVQWSVADASVASIDGQGLLTSRSRGQTSITAVSDTARAHGRSVVVPKATGIAIAPDAGTINAIGDTLRLAVTARDRNGNALGDAQIGWSSLDPSVATVTGTGEVTAKAAGVAPIVAASDAAADTATIVVRQVIAAVSVTPTSPTIAAGTTVQLTASVKDSNGVVVSDASFAWASSDADAVEISASGLARGRKARVATVTATATATGTSGTAVIAVVPGPAQSLAKVGGDAQTGLAGVELPQRVSVRVLDAFDNPVPGANVSWTTPAGSGVVNSGGVTTDAAGLSSARWTLGSTKGTHIAQASVGTLVGSPIAFAATATPNGRITGQLTASASLQGQSAAVALTAKSRSLRLGPSTQVSAARPEYVPGSLIVRFRGQAVGMTGSGFTSLGQGLTARAVARAMRARLEPAARSGRLQIAGTSPAILAARVRVHPARLEAAAAELLKDPGVLTVEREAIGFALEGTRPGRALAAPSKLPNDTTYYRQAWHYSMLDLPEAWALTTGSSDVLVAVVDDGMRFDHPAIAANLTKDGYDFVSTGLFDVCGVSRDNAGDGNGYDPDPTVPARYDCSGAGGLSSAGGHGLHVAGTIGAVGNDVLGATGVNWSVRIRPVRVLGVSGSGSYYDIAQGILYAAGLLADDGAGGHVPSVTAARIINVSLGGSAESTVLRDAVQAASAAGVLIIASAGNSASSTPNYPAAYPEVLSVSAVGPDMQLAPYSTFGPTVDVAAPGGDSGDCAGTCTVWSTTWNFAQGTPTYSYNQGTSMAAPHVSGVAALVLAAEPLLSAAQLRARLTTYAVDVGASGRDDFYGAGVVNARNSLTRSFAPSRALYATLYDARTGARLQTVRAAADATYAFAALDDGTYFVFAGEDEAGDGVAGVPGRRWGASGSGTTRPTEIRVAGAGTYPAAVSVGWPLEAEPNDGPTSAGRLVHGGYVHGHIAGTADVDWFVITVPGGQYVFETSAWDGACGYALEADTVLELMGLDGARIEVNDNADPDPNPRGRCSRVSRALAAGSYYVKVTASYAGRYRLAARSDQ